MPIIKSLPENLINKIAAGEVVERPASVVKELVENSIDAKANRIVVEVEEGGKTLIKISDNGLGMDRDDALKAFERHATSKIYDENDLFEINTMGFRGEAIASMAAVSNFELKTKQKDKLSGTMIVSKGGEISDPEDLGMSDGTVISVKNLFYNTPARLKFLKTDNTEFSHISELINDLALGYPAIAFKLIHNGKVIMDFQQTDDLQQRISDVLGLEVGRNLLHVECLSTSPSITGFVGKPAIARRSRQSQYLFVNGRAVKDNSISHAVLDGFFSILPEKKYPSFVLFIEIEPNLVDVNIHPRKSEVRFANKNQLYSLVKKAIQKAVEVEQIIPEFQGEARSYWHSEKSYQGLNSQPKIGDNFVKQNHFSSNSNPRNFDHLTRKNSVNEAMIFSESFLKHDSSPGPKFKILGQVKLSYILAADYEGLFIVDQHAAHERVMYQKLVEAAENKTIEKQALLMPIVVELNKAEIALLKDNLIVFERIGFEVEEFGGQCFQISAVPVEIAQANIQEVFKGVIDDLLDGRWTRKIQEPEHEVICYTACRSAIKFGQKLELTEMQSLLEQLEDLKQKSTCPHGRPTMIRLSFDELEKRFGRK